MDFLVKCIWTISPIIILGWLLVIAGDVAREHHKRKKSLEAHEQSWRDIQQKASGMEKAERDEPWESEARSLVDGFSTMKVGELSQTPIEWENTRWINKDGK